ncbi:MAG: hypothetical protein FRX48_05531 [Lasallia pustulata]|uniref:Uncharacterized protein n=1 Tax=Lasallia pustulata TaxID=136370 RepID=A0A5M8PNP8_9LECA|nr:MAG: hypothetical protein FRX48_05531 [Lasallia pustulata]
MSSHPGLFTCVLVLLTALATLLRHHEAPVSVLDSLDPETAGSFPAVDAKARDPEQPAGMGMRKRAWSLGRMLLPYEK